MYRFEESEDSEDENSDEDEESVDEIDDDENVKRLKPCLEKVQQAIDKVKDIYTSMYEPRTCLTLQQAAVQYKFFEPKLTQQI